MRFQFGPLPSPAPSLPSPSPLGPLVEASLELPLEEPSEASELLPDPEQPHDPAQDPSPL